MTEPLVTPPLAVALPQPGSLGAWWMAARPKTLTAGAAPVLVGSAVAWHEGRFRVLPGLAALAGALLLQIGSNLAHDGFDFETGTDTEERVGPVRAAQARLLSPGELKRGMVGVFALALLVGVYLTFVSGPWIVVIGVLSILSAILYTGGPYPLGYHGLGDVFVLLFFGLAAVAGTTFIHLEGVPLLAWLYAVALGALAVNILVVNNVRDRSTDVRTGKRTLAVRFGRRAAEIEFATMLGLAFLAPIAGALLGESGPVPCIALLLVPHALSLFRKLRTTEGRALNPILGETARLVFLYAAFVGVGLLLDRTLAGGGS